MFKFRALSGTFTWIGKGCFLFTRMGRDTSFFVINNRDTTHSIARLAISDFGSLSKELIIYYDFVRRYVDRSMNQEKVNY